MESRVRDSRCARWYGQRLAGFVLLMTLILMATSGHAQRPASAPDIVGMTILASDSPFLEERSAARPALLAQLDSARSRWTSFANESMRYRVRAVCACIEIPRPPSYVTVVTQGDSVLSVVDEQGRPARVPLRLQGVPSPSRLFALAEAAIRGDAERVAVEFDRDTGLPTRIRTDPKIFVADDEFELQITVERSRSARSPDER